VKEDLERVHRELRRIVRANLGMTDEVNRYLLLMRGKMFRPTLVLLADRICGGDGDPTVTLAAAVELVHLATLVHDDAVDHSVLRRGLPTVNALWTHQVAIIMGDYLYSRSVTELTRAGNLEVLRCLAVAANEMSLGEMRQLTSYDALDFSEEDYYALIAAKTASLMAASCEIGALVNGSNRECKALRRFGHHLGMAFQIADDLLDYTGTEAVTGKPTGHDLRQRKVTLPLVGAMKSAGSREQGVIRGFFTRRDPSDEEIAGLIDLVAELGGLEYARERAARYADWAAEALEDLEDGPAKHALMTAIAYAVDRRR
jgi:octaprenyl-diphosphate synthase